MAANDPLFDAFREDHAILGRGFHDLSQSLRAHDIEAAKAAARHLDAVAGAHIAFEERHFYPALIPLLGANDVERLFGEHQLGLDVVHKLLALQAGETLSKPQWSALLKQSQEMEQHIAECGELFAAMGRIDAADRETLLQRLLELREAAPRWTDLAAGDGSTPAC